MNFLLLLFTVSYRRRVSGLSAGSLRRNGRSGFLWTNLDAQGHRGAYAICLSIRQANRSRLAATLISQRGNSCTYRKMSWPRCSRTNRARDRLSC
jgi:hypothetical protein